MLAEFAGDLAEHLLGGLRLLGDPGVLAHAGDGQSAKLKRMSDGTETPVTLDDKFSEKLNTMILEIV